MIRFPPIYFVVLSVIIFSDCCRASSYENDYYAEMERSKIPTAVKTVKNRLSHVDLGDFHFKSEEGITIQANVTINCPTMLKEPGVDDGLVEGRPVEWIATFKMIDQKTKDKLSSHPFYFTVNYKGDTSAWVEDTLLWHQIDINNLSGFFPMRKEWLILKLK